MIRNVPYNKWNNPYNKRTDNRCKNSNNGANSLLGTTFSNIFLPLCFVLPVDALCFPLRSQRCAPYATLLSGLHGHCGNPGYFITFTANPNREEIFPIMSPGLPFHAAEASHGPSAASYQKHMRRTTKYYKPSIRLHGSIIHKHKHEHSLYRPKPFFRLFSFKKMASTQYYYQFLQLQLSPHVYHLYMISIKSASRDMDNSRE